MGSLISLFNIMGYNGIEWDPSYFMNDPYHCSTQYTPSCGETPCSSDFPSLSRSQKFWGPNSQFDSSDDNFFLSLRSAGNNHLKISQNISKYLKIPLHTPIKNSSPRKTSQVVLNPTNLGFAPFHFELPTSTSQLFAI